VAEITRFPKKYIERLQNRLGPRAVLCAITDRWLKFEQRGGVVNNAHLVLVDVMKLKDEGEFGFGASRKLMQLAISREDLLRAVENVQWEDDQMPSGGPSPPLEEQVNRIVDDAIARLGALSSDAYVQEAIMKATIREVCHRLADMEHLGRDDIADQLDVMADVLREMTSDEPP